MNPRSGLAGGLATLLLAWAAGPVAALAASPTGRASPPHNSATLQRAAAVFARPDPASTPLETVPAVRPITHEQTVLPVLATALDLAGKPWLEVLLPGRPNGHAGWIAGDSATVGEITWALTVHTSTRRVNAYLNGRFIRSFKAVVGKPSTPTPIGRFFVEESIRLSGPAVGAPFALALSARSNVLQEFDGGPGQIALHGTDNVGGVLGTAASHGCIRLATPAITWLADRIPPGTPVRIMS